MLVLSELLFIFALMRRLKRLLTKLEWFSKRTGTSFQNGKARGESAHDSISTSGVSVAVLPNKFRTSFRWFSRRDQNAWDLRKFCAYKRDNAVWNYFRTHFQDNLVPSFGLFGVFWENLPLHLCWIPERKHNRWQTSNPRF